MFIEIAGEKLEVQKNGRFTVECLLGETASVLLSAAVQQIDGTAAATIEGTRITPRALGQSRYRLTATDGTVAELRLYTCEPACLDFIGASFKSVGAGGGADTPTWRRHTLRSVVQHREYDGIFDGTVGKIANITLANHGSA